MFLVSLKNKAKKIKSNTLVVYYAAKDHRMPIWLRLLAFFVAAYALSPIDLIPDFIPVIGLLDDIIIIPICLVLILRFTPPIILESAMQQAQENSKKPVSYGATVVIILIWLIALYLILNWIRHQFF